MRSEFQGPFREGPGDGCLSEGGGMPLEPPGLTSIFEGQPPPKPRPKLHSKQGSFELDNKTEDTLKPQGLTNGNLKNDRVFLKDSS